MTYVKSLHVFALSKLHMWSDHGPQMTKRNKVNYYYDDYYNNYYYNLGGIPTSRYL